MLQAELSPSGQARDARVVPFIQREGRGVLRDSTGATIAFLQKLSQEDFGASAARIDGSGAVLKP